MPWRPCSHKAHSVQIHGQLAGRPLDRIREGDAEEVGDGEGHAALAI